jgi:hypothetical protein
MVTFLLKGWEEGEQEHNFCDFQWLPLTIYVLTTAIGISLASLAWA